ncbi:MAG: DUF938 domain-containing protein [Rhodobacteraceae bacterium]|nr:DUF938 domain-containing protein [Paracoccaceae bacterium]
MKTGEQPKVHSNADDMGDGRLSAPSAARNTGPICSAMKDFAPQKGRALEIASGTGQHVVAYARAFPGIIWQPTDIDPDRLTSIDAWTAAEGGANLLGAQMLDAGAPDWDLGRFDFVTITNLFHLISDQAAVNVIAGVARGLNPDGVFFIYGPFRKHGEFRSTGDKDFHCRISADDPAAGYKDVDWMQATAKAAGLTPLAEIEMPANNLSLVWRAP